LLLAIAALLFLTLLFEHISYPPLWHDESDTVMFGQRVVEYGYPKVHGPKNVVYGLTHALRVGVDDRTDAYIGAPWGYYYYAAIGVALARNVDDLYVRTALVRLPFAAIGALGLLVLLLAVRDSIDDANRRRWFAILYWLFAAYSISLILHLREARYYGLLVFITCALVAVFVRYHVYQRLGYGAYVALTTVLLFLLFNTFYPAYPIFLVTLGLHHVGRAAFGAGSRAERLGWLMRSCLPLALSLATTMPLLLYFEFLTQVKGWIEEYDATLRAYGTSLRVVFLNLSRYEFLLPALVLRAAVMLEIRLHPLQPTSSALLRRRQIASFLFLFMMTYWLILARSVSVWERYFIPLSPIITTMFLLDAFTYRDLIRDSSMRPGWRQAVAGTLVVICLATSFGWRIPEFRGRVHEITHRYMGPLDFAIPYLKEKYPQPEELMIATNYEGPALMYYLGSHVIVGFYGGNLENEVELEPDVILPRAWRENMDPLAEMVRRAPYEFKRFPVKNIPTNGFPGLSRLFDGPMHHNFQTQLAEEGESRLVILERSSSRSPTGLLTPDPPAM
jgi:hypothetical protein